MDRWVVGGAEGDAPPCLLVMLCYVMLQQPFRKKRGKK